MSDDPSRPDDDSLRYNAEALAEKHGISVEEAQALLARAKVVPPTEDDDTDS